MNNKNHDVIGLTQNIKNNLADFPALLHCWRFLVGVVYALNQYTKIANSCPFTTLSDDEYVQETDNVLTSISKNTPPAENWLRGFFYNAALMRLDAAYERFFKAYLDGKCNLNLECTACDKNKIDGPYLYAEIRKEFSSLFSEKKFEDSNFGKVRHEVNSLKHYIGGANLTEREQPEILRQALDELIAFLKDPTVRKDLTMFSGGYPITGRK